MSDHVFTWKDAIFCSACEASKVKVAWYYSRKLFRHFNHEGESDVNSDVEANNDGNIFNERDSDLDLDEDLIQDPDFNQQDVFINHESAFKRELEGLKNKGDQARSRSKSYLVENDDISQHAETLIHFYKGTTELDLRTLQYGCNVENTDFSLVASGYSFDPLCQIQVPVFLVSMLDRSSLKKSSVSCERKSKETLSVKFMLLGLSEVNPTPSRLLFHKRQTEHDEKSYKLIPLRMFWLKNDAIGSTSFLHKNIVFMSNYGFIHVNSQSATLSICFGSPQTRGEAHIQQFFCGRDVIKKEGIIHSFDCYNFLENHSFVIVALMCDEKDDDDYHSRSCVALCFHKNGKLPHSYKMEHVQMEMFFPHEFSQIVLSFSVKSAVLSRFQVVSSSVIIVSTTGFALQFIDGEMTHSIRLVNAIINPPLQSAHVDIVVIGGTDSKSDNQAAFRVNDTCDIIDWSKRGIVSSHCNTVFLGKFDSLCNGYPSILLLLSSNSTTAITSGDLCLEKLISLVIDCTKSEGGRKSPQLSKDRKIHQQDNECKEADDVTQNVLEGLISQEKKCFSELRELEQEVKDKEIFVKNMQKMFSWNLSIGHGSDGRSRYLQPLVPIIGDPTLQPKGRQVKSSPNPILRFGKLWQRTVDSLLVCGIEVNNISRTSQITEMMFSLIPINPSTPCTSCNSTAFYKISTSCLSDSPARKKICLEDEAGVDAAGCLQATLKSGETAFLTAYTNTEQILGGGDVIFKVSLTYKSRIGNQQLESQSEDESTRHNICCGQILLSVNDVISGTYSMQPQLARSDGGGLNKEDILALDCIQKCCDLEIKSVMTSVLSLKSAIRTSPCLNPVTLEDQYIFAADHTLRYCRIKWLEQESKHVAKIKAYTRSQPEIVLLVQFLYNLAPRDITITLSKHHSQLSDSAVKDICQSLIDRVDTSITHLKEELCIKVQSSSSGADKKGAAGDNQNEEAFQTSNATRIDEGMKKSNEVRNNQKSPTFQSSAWKRGKSSQTKTNNFPTASSSIVSDESKGGSPMQLKDGLNTAEAYVFRSGNDLESKNYNNPAKWKGKVGKGGISKAKSKLMMKK